MTLSIALETRCAGCGLPKSHCCCDDFDRYDNTLGVLPFDLAVLVHPNEIPRPSSTSPLISYTLPVSQSLTWARAKLPTTLASRFKSPDLTRNTYLLFPADKEETQTVNTLTVKHWATHLASAPSTDKQARPLVIVLDGNWKEVRKMLRQTPALQTLTRITLSPSEPSQYTLRRHTDDHHLCTAESVAALYCETFKGCRSEGSHPQHLLLHNLKVHAQAFVAWKAL